MTARNGGRGQCSASPALWAPGPPHLSVPLISDPLDLNLFPPHLLRGFSVPGRGGDRWVVGGGSPHTVLMNGLAAALSSWSAGHLLHSHLLGGRSREDCQPGSPQPCSLGTQAGPRAPPRHAGSISSSLKTRTRWQPEGTACGTRHSWTSHSGPRTLVRPFPHRHCCPQVPGQTEDMALPGF